MGRKFRRFSFRVGAVAATAAVGWFVCHRWGLRSASVCETVTIPEEWSTDAGSTTTTRRLQHRDAFARTMTSSAADASSSLSTARSGPASNGEPFDVLVVGGGVTGLYAAVDAAQRGLKVALLEAADFGSGSSGTQPLLTPGAFPYVQRAIRQRDSRWLWRAYETLENATVWHNTAPGCMQLSASSFTRETNNSPQSSLNEEQASLVQVSRARTLIPALHTAELVEFSVAAWLSTCISVFAGPLRLCAPLRSSSAVNRELPSPSKDAGLAGNNMGRGPVACGGIVTHDFVLDGNKAALSLARTAEALGVTLLNYAELTGLRYEESLSAAAASEASPSSPSADNLLVATGLDLATAGRDRIFEFRTRGVINCAGAGVDHVRALMPDNALDAVPNVFDRFLVYSYLVAPRTALFRPGGDSSEAPTQGVSWASKLPSFLDKTSFANGDRNPMSGEGGPSHEQHTDRAFRWLTKPGAGLQVASTLYSFSTMLVSPWHDDTVLLGPSITPLSMAHLAPGRSATPPTTTAKAPTLSVSHTLASLSLHGTDGFQAQRRHIVKALASCGIGVHTDQLLSCVSTVVPLTKNPRAIPFADDLLVKGYHVHTFSRATGPADEGGSAYDIPMRWQTQKGRTAPFVTVYGGTALAARQIAEEAVNTFVHKTNALPETYRRAHGKALAHSATRYLRLAALPHEADREETASALSESGRPRVPMNEEERLARMVASTYVVHLSDVLARRLHVAFTSPAQAAAAAPELSTYVATLMGWSKQRAAAESSTALTFVERYAVKQSGAQGRS